MSTTTQDAPKRLSSMEAFSAELDRIMPVVTRVARRFAPLGDADDVIQEACLAAWRYRHRFDPEQGSFQTWVVRILLNESYKTVGRRRRNGLLLGRLADRSLSAETPSGGSDRQLETAIAGLPRRQREVIELTLANIVYDARAARAMEVDLNQSSTNVITYTHTGNGVAVPQMLPQNEHPNPSRCLQPSSRDFIAVLAR